MLFAPAPKTVCCLWICALVLGCQTNKAPQSKDTSKVAHKTQDDETAKKSRATSNEKKTPTPKIHGFVPNPGEPEEPTYALELMVPPKARLKAPERFKVLLTTTKGDIQINVDKSWAPKGADRFYNLVKYGYYTDVAFFRVIGGFMAQTGLHGDARMNRVWRNARIEDDVIKSSNTRGAVTFAMAGPNSRTTQFFINFGDNSRLDRMGFSPFGMVDAESMKVVDSLYAGYGEGQPRGKGPSQGLIQSQGNPYLKQEFPKLDYILKAQVLEQ